MYQRVSALFIVVSLLVVGCTDYPDRAAGSVPTDPLIGRWVGEFTTTVETADYGIQVSSQRIVLQFDGDTVRCWLLEADGLLGSGYGPYSIVGDSLTLGELCYSNAVCAILPDMRLVDRLHLELNQNRMMLTGRAGDWITNQQAVLVLESRSPSLTLYGFDPALLNMSIRAQYVP